jgi:hypothetical protein
MKTVFPLHFGFFTAILPTPHVISFLIQPSSLQASFLLSPTLLVSVGEINNFFG